MSLDHLRFIRATFRYLNIDTLILVVYSVAAISGFELISGLHTYVFKFMSLIHLFNKLMIIYICYSFFFTSC